MPPVEDHEVHESVKRDRPSAGCFNRTGLAAGRWMQDGWIDGPSGKPYMPNWVWREHTMSTACRQIHDLPECEGCTAPKDVEYIEKMRKMVTL